MTTTPSKSNPTGITDFAIPDALAELPEWQELAQAMNRCALAAGNLDVTQTQWNEAIRNLAAGVAFMDCCPECERVTDDVAVDTSAAPANVLIRGGVSGIYVCRNGHVWNCWHSLTFPTIW